MRTLFVILIILLAINVFAGLQSDVELLDQRSRIEGTRIDVRRIHDKQSGVEVLCFESHDGTGVSTGIGCVATGRNWK